MRPRFRKRVLAGALVLASGLELGLSTAQAQFPVFYGGQVLTPFGNRGSDGSYLNRSQAPRARRPLFRQRAYYPTQSYQSYYYTPQPPRYYAPSGGYYARGYYAPR